MSKKTRYNEMIHNSSNVKPQLSSSSSEAKEALSKPAADETPAADKVIESNAAASEPVKVEPQAPTVAPVSATLSTPEPVPVREIVKKSGPTIF